jgi:hypothetical protein
MMHEFTYPHHVTTKNLIITSVMQHIFFTAIRNSKLVTARRGPSQLVMPQECTHTRFKSCKMTTKYFNHYIHLYLQHIFFTVIQNSKLVKARRSWLCRTNVHFQVSSHVKWRQKIQSLHLFYNIYLSPKYEMHSSSQHLVARRSSSFVIPNQSTY